MRSVTFFYEKCLLMFYLIFVLVIFLFSSAQCYSQEKISTSELKERFMKEAPLKWDEYLRLFPKIEGTSVEIIRSSLKKDVKEIKNSFTCDYPGMVFKSQSKDYSYHYCANERYSFALNHEKESPLLDECLPLDKQAIPDLKDWTFPAMSKTVKRNSSINFITEIVAQGLLLDHKWLPLLLKCQNFKIDEIEEIFKNNEHLVRLKFSNNVKTLNDEAYLMNVRSGELFLLPDYYWLVKSGACSFWSEKVSYNTEWNNSYEYDQFPAPQLLSRQLTTLYSKNQERIQREIKYDFKPVLQEDPSQFTLSYYGLPEPEFEVRRGRFQMVRFIFMTAGAALVVFVLYQIARKKREKQA